MQVLRLSPRQQSWKANAGTGQAVQTRGEAELGSFGPGPPTADRFLSRGPSEIVVPGTQTPGQQRRAGHSQPNLSEGEGGNAVSRGSP